jgi:hypothetical protein
MVDSIIPVHNTTLNWIVADISAKRLIIGIRGKTAGFF